MSTINQLSAIDVLSGSESIPVYSPSNGDIRRISASNMRIFMQEGNNALVDKTTQYAAPSATGFSVAITDSSASIWLILTPGAGYAAGTIVLPALANCEDKQEVLVNCTQAITTLTINGNGSTVTGAPTAMTANSFFRLRFDDVTNVWYRVG